MLGVGDYQNPSVCKVWPRFGRARGVGVSGWLKFLAQPGVPGASSLEDLGLRHDQPEGKFRLQQYHTSRFDAGWSMVNASSSIPSMVSAHKPQGGESQTERFSPGVVHHIPRKYGVLRIA